MGWELVDLGVNWMGGVAGRSECDVHFSCLSFNYAMPFWAFGVWRLGSGKFASRYRVAYDPGVLG